MKKIFFCIFMLFNQFILHGYAIPNFQQTSRFTFSYAAGQIIGISQDYAEAELFSPFYFSRSNMAFFDIFGYRFNDHMYGTSIGIGHRHRLKYQSILGINVFYDYLKKDHLQSYNRLGFGLELFMPVFEARLNAYFPIGNQTRYSTAQIFNNYIGNYFAICREKLYSLGYGIDGDIGAYLLKCHGFKIFGCIGPYYFTSKNNAHFFGGMTRIQFLYRQFVSFELRNSFDIKNKFRTQLQLNFNIPFEIFPNCLKWCLDNIILRPVYRNKIIFTKTCCKYSWNW